MKQAGALPDSQPPTPGAGPLSVMQRTQDRLGQLRGSNFRKNARNQDSGIDDFQFRC
jgi:hypothetical protein